jgi:hypothetical protein
VANSSSLIFNIIARYQGDKAVKSAADGLDRFVRSAGKLIAVAPTAQAATAGLVAGVGAATATFASAGVALGAFGAAIGPQVKRMSEASTAAEKMAKAQETAANKQQVADQLRASGSKLAEKAQKAATSAKLSAIQAENAYKRATAGLPKSTADAALSFAKLKVAYKSWSDSLSPTTMPMFTKAFGTVRKMLPSLTPLVRTASAALNNFFNSAADGVNQGGFARFMNRMNESAKVVLPNLLLSIKNVFKGFGGIIKAFLPSTAGFSSGMEEMTRKFAKWGQGLGNSEGFKNFMSYIREHGPKLMEVFRNLGSAVVKIIEALGPLTGQSLALVGAFAALVSAIPTPVLTILMRWITLTYIALKIYKTYQVAANTAAAAWALIQRRGGIQGMFQVAVLRAQLIALRAWSAATRIAAAVQWAFNAAMNAGGIGLVITIIAAIIAVIVLLATKTKFFQTVWAGVVKGVTVAIEWVVKAFKWLWNVLFGHSIIPDIIAAFKAAWLVLQSLCMWLYNNVIKPIWNAIGVAIKVVVFLIKGYINGIVMAFRFFAAMGRAAWAVLYAGIMVVWGWIKTNIINPLRIYFTVMLPMAARMLAARVKAGWLMLQMGIMAVWGWIKSNIINPLRLFFTVLIPAAARALAAKVKAGWMVLYTGIMVVWNWVKSKIINPLRTYFTVMLPYAARRLAFLVRAQWLKLQLAIWAVWQWIKSKVLNPIKNFFTKTIPEAGRTMKSKLMNAFESMVDGIKKAWSKLKEVVKGPVKFFVQTVYNDGLRKAWNNTAGKIPGVPDLKEAKLPKGFATGGKIHGPGGPKEDKVPIMASPGEYMIRAKAVRQVGVGFLNRLNNGAAKPYPEKHLGAGRNGAAGSGFALGGLIPDAVKNVAGKVWDAAGNGLDWAKNFTRDIAAKALKALFKPFKAMVTGVTDKFPEAGIMGTAVKKFVLSGFDKMMAFAEGMARDDADPSVAGALKFAKSQAGKPYRWGGVGPGGYDCSGFMSAIQNVIEGKKPHRRRWATGAFSGNRAPSGWKRHLESNFKVGITNRGVGHTAGTLGGVKVESRGGDGVVVGSRARGHKAGMFGSNWYGLKAATGSGGGSGRWAQTVESVLKELGLYSSANLRNVLKAIQKESGGNPKAINKWDSNAKAGRASRGLLQTIPSTFNAYAGKYKSRGIYDPYANIYAAVRYARSTYGKGWSARMARPGGYAEGGVIPSFDSGGTLMPGLNTVWNGLGKPEPLTRADQAGGEEYHFHFEGSTIYAKSEREFEDMVVGALRNVKRKGRTVP